MSKAEDNRMRHDWDARARHAMRLYVATWYAHSDETWEEGTRRDAAYLADRLPPDLGPGHACLDLGCGAGRLLPALASRFERVTGVDVSPEMLAQARQVIGDDPRISLHLTDGRTLAGLADTSFHFVLANAVYIHCDTEVIGSLLAEVDRVLVPGGLFAATFNSAEPPPYIPAHARAMAGSHGEEQTGDRPATTAPLPVPEVTAADLALLGGPTWDGARFTRQSLVEALAAAHLVPHVLQPMDTVWNVLATKES